MAGTGVWLASRAAAAEDRIYGAEPGGLAGAAGRPVGSGSCCALRLCCAERSAGGTMPPSSKMTAGAWPHGDRPDHVPGLRTGSEARSGLPPADWVWTAIRAGNGGPRHLITIGPGRPARVRPVTGSTTAWLRTLRRHDPPGYQDAGRRALNT